MRRPSSRVPSQGPAIAETILADGSSLPGSAPGAVRVTLRRPPCHPLRPPASAWLVPRGVCRWLTGQVNRQGGLPEPAVCKLRDTIYLLVTC